jgi:hypothetical protein
MRDVWSWLSAVLLVGGRIDLGLPPVIEGALLGVLLGVVVPLALLGLVWCLMWGIQHGRCALRVRRLPVGRRVAVPLDDRRPDFEQFTARELVRLRRLRRLYYGYGRRHVVSERS